MMAAEFLRASITLTIAVVHPAQERSEGNYGCGVAITFCFSTSFPLAAASQLLMKNKGSVSYGHRKSLLSLDNYNLKRDVS